ncbi:hypothetical protein [Aminipila terrae]|uniref:Type II secretion system protein n=1 Tax=Aminipila terrae TaxID=2697030 RepID=A0A6P1MB25_9FIRM|nr:hypothetical protein [Aminipila terrae]QHI71830.1 hypothetical protein Ami3637_04995 [Aminipila terrae]
MSNRNSSQLFLMEFICVVMFFALCAGLCLNAFVKADNISKQGKQLNEAVLLAQSMAETIKAMDSPSHENIAAAADKLNKEDQNELTVMVRDRVLQDMLQADIYVYGSKDDVKKICSISINKYLPGEV